ncbi:type-F conjugative transfer system secretin TraK [Croceibacterium mercuriale]|uniref:type-F conjugative transfer system secretin TraK n=1 Tax=Croceibacterium mercuriale TaxID=1572751 RepID=UPI0009DFB1EA|nr:type-F conjugative transfer system secretin TraK [Croceibacterium mercuriale]
MRRSLQRLAACSVMSVAALLAVPAFADQSIMVADNGEVQCEVSEQDLTRISLKDDAFAAVSKIEAGSPLEDFSVVHEPTRGDLYISVPEGYTRPSVSFFGTTQKGFVYKFSCQVGGADARQVFVTNADLENPQPPATELASAAPLNDQALGLVGAMFEQRTVRGFEIRDEPRAPVNVGDLKVQLVSEYLSPTLAGKVLRIENTGGAPMTLAEELVAADGAIAVSIANRELQPGQVTAAYVVTPAQGF